MRSLIDWQGERVSLSGSLQPESLRNHERLKSRMILGLDKGNCPVYSRGVRLSGEPANQFYDNRIRKRGQRPLQEQERLLHDASMQELSPSFQGVETPESEVEVPVKAIEVGESQRKAEVKGTEAERKGAETRCLGSKERSACSSVG